MEYFGLDIGNNTIRVTQLRKTQNSYNLVAYATAPIPPGLSQSDSDIDQQTIAKKLAELVKKAGINTKNVVAAVPGTSVFNVLVKLPAMPKNELEKAVRYQAEQNLPLKLDEVKYDWAVVSEDQNTKEVSVMIIAAGKGKIAQTMKLFEYAGLNVIALETATVALARSLSTPNDPLIMVLDIGATTTEIAVVEQGVLMQTRSFPLGGLAMTRAISQNLRLEPDQAELFKQRFGLSQDKLEGQVYKAIEPVLRNIMVEAVRSSKFYQEQFGKAVQRVVITGGSSKLPLITEYIKSTMGVEVMVGNPWSKVSYSSNLNNNLIEVAPYFGTAVGLAMRD